MLVISRDEAQLARSPVYFTGKRCSRGHVALRWTNNYTCTACHKEASKKSARHRKQVLDLLS